MRSYRVGQKLFFFLVQMFDSISRGCQVKKKMHILMCTDSLFDHLDCWPHICHCVVATTKYICAQSAPKRRHTEIHSEQTRRRKGNSKTVNHAKDRSCFCWPFLLSAPDQIIHQTVASFENFNLPSNRRLSFWRFYWVKSIRIANKFVLKFNNVCLQNVTKLTNTVNETERKFVDKSVCR